MPTAAVVISGVALGAAALALALAWRWRAALRALQREQQMLSMLVDTTPFAIVLFAAEGGIVFTNIAARQLFFEGADVQGQNFVAMLERAPPALRHALSAEDDALVSLDVQGESEIFYLSKRNLQVAGRDYLVVAVKPVTEPFTRREIDTLKRVIRIIGHEVNNSLGPIASLMGTARTILSRPEHLGRLDGIFATVEERAQHLQKFLSGYGELAKLPAPKPALVDWQAVLSELAALWPDVAVGPGSGAGYFDRAQIQQVLIDLVKNAVEAGGPRTEVRVQVERPAEGGWRVTVLDRGPGMTDEVMRNALLPFFTTKPGGSGLGLALCREILEQHHGRLRLARRVEGGMAISFWLPDRERPLPALDPGSRIRLTLTHT